MNIIDAHVHVVEHIAGFGRRGELRPLGNGRARWGDGTELQLIPPELGDREVVGAVLDPPNLTPPSRYEQRDTVLAEMCATLENRIAVVHMKDFRLNASGGYDLPGPLMGEMNYALFLQQVGSIPAGVPVIAEHLEPSQFAEARRRLLAL